MARVVDKFILQLELQLADQNVHIQLDDEAREWLTDKGYDKLNGARPMGRLIQEKIKQPLAEELLFGKLVDGGEVQVQHQGRPAGVRTHPRPAQGAPRPRPKPPVKANEQGQAREPTRRQLLSARGQSLKMYVDRPD